MCGNGNKITGPIRDVNPCYKCQKPTRHLGCHDTCKGIRNGKPRLRESMQTGASTQDRATSVGGRNNGKDGVYAEA